MLENVLGQKVWKDVKGLGITRFMRDYKTSHKIIKLRETLDGCLLMRASKVGRSPETALFPPSKIDHRNVSTRLSVFFAAAFSLTRCTFASSLSQILATSSSASPF